MATTPAHGIYYPTTATQISPLATQFALLAQSVDTAVAATTTRVAGLEDSRFGNVRIPSSVVGATMDAKGLLRMSTTNAVSSISVNGVFDTSFLTYRIQFYAQTSANTSVKVRLRSAGADYTGVSYSHRSLEGLNNNTAISYTNTESSWETSSGSSTYNWGYIDITNPARTGVMKVYGTQVGNSSLSIAARTGYVNGAAESVSYDGFSIVLTTPCTFSAESFFRVYGLA